jgi:hypothetical protein
MHEKWGHSIGKGFEIKMMVKSSAMEIVLKSWRPFRIYFSTNQRSQSDWIRLEE